VLGDRVRGVAGKLGIGRQRDPLLAQTRLTPKSHKTEHAELLQLFAASKRSSTRSRTPRHPRWTLGAEKPCEA
jgi:hypothetical protein